MLSDWCSAGSGASMRVRGDKVAMAKRARLPIARSSAIVATFALALAGCTSAPTPTTSKAGRSKEYFAESEYGVKASPRVSNLRTRLPRGGGRDMVGKPYKVKGKWYKPKEEPGYTKVGAASWYGDAFHGRLTANGEIYDMTHLTAAHPTMPLPSYARVTNTKNGASIVVRVNDRGPYAHGRVIDLSKRAAELLDYQHAGVAKVKVEYVGRAPLHGRDDNYLLASYRPGKSGLPGKLPRVDDGLPAGVMIAMAGDTPTRRQQEPIFAKQQPTPQVAAPLPVPVAAPVALAGVAGLAAVTGGVTKAPLPSPFSVGEAPATGAILASDPILPQFGPAVPERPYDGFGAPPAGTLGTIKVAAMSYADHRVAGAAAALDKVVTGFAADDVRASWRRMHGFNAPLPAGGGEFVAAGSFVVRAEAEALSRRLAFLGSTSVVADGDAYSVELRANGSQPADMLAELARQSGAPDAFLVRD